MSHAPVTRTLRSPHACLCSPENCKKNTCLQATLCSSRKYPYSSHRWDWKFLSFLIIIIIIIYALLNDQAKLPLLMSLEENTLDFTAASTT